jgi:hypothetical protein
LKHVSLRRKTVVYLLLTLLVAGHVLDVATSQEHWPFSPYPMYAEAQTSRTLRVTRLIGITATTPPREVALNATWLRNTLSVWEESSQYHRDKIPAAARSYLLRYNHQRLKSTSSKMPRLAGIKVYEYVWKMTDHRPGEGKPDQRNLVTQVWMQGYKPAHSKKKKKKPKPTTAVVQPKELDVAH